MSSFRRIRSWFWQMISAIFALQVPATIATASSGVFPFKVRAWTYSSFAANTCRQWPSTGGFISSSRSEPLRIRSGSEERVPAAVCRTVSARSKESMYRTATMSEGERGTSALAAIIRSGTGPCGSTYFRMLAGRKSALIGQGAKAAAEGAAAAAGAAASATHLALGGNRSQLCAVS